MVKTKDSLDDKTDDVYNYMVKGRCTIVRYSSVANILFIENRENEYKNYAYIQELNHYSSTYLAT